LVAFEDLKIAHLVKNHHLPKSISDASWELFLSSRPLLWSSRFRRASPRKIASPCGFRVKKTLSMRTHFCPSCGLVLDRDWNAALNILAAALMIVAALNRTAGQAETGSASAEQNASGQSTEGLRKRLRSAKLAG
jgi:putative transposase